jgi:hypothetical protein
MTVYLQPQCCKVVVAPFLLALSGAEPFVCVCVLEISSWSLPSVCTQAHYNWAFLRCKVSHT